MSHLNDRSIALDGECPIPNSLLHQMPLGFCEDDRHTQEAYKRNKGKLIEHNPYSDLEEFPDESSLFIGDLSRTVTEDMLLKLFSECGPVDGVDIKRDKVTKNNLGYGFVKFKDRQMAERAKIKMNGYEIGGRAIRIGWAQKNTNLFVCLVGDIDEKINGEHLREIFSDFGPIYEEDTFVKRNKYGFVKFKHRAHAEKAKAALDGKHLILCDGYKTQKPVRIGWGDANTQRNCVHVQFEQNSASNVDLKEDDFKLEFQKYGTVNKVSLPRYSDKRLKGYGFIHFEENDEGEESAARAITELTASQIKGVVIMCNFGKRQNQRHKRFAQKKQNGDGMPMGSGYDQNQGMNAMNYDNMNMNNMNSMNNMSNMNNMNNMNMAFDRNQNDFNASNNMNQMNNINMNEMNQMSQMNPNQAINEMHLMNNMNNMNQAMNMNNMSNMMNMNQGMSNMMMNNMMNMAPPPPVPPFGYNPNNMDNNTANINNNQNMMNNMPPPHHMMPNMNNMNMNHPMTGSPQNTMSGPPLSGPNPFFPQNPNINNLINPMMIPPGNNNPQITVGVGPPNMMSMNGVPPSPPPPNIPIPPDPSSFKINKPTDPNLHNNDKNDRENTNKFPLPFPPSFPPPQAAPQLNMTHPNGGTGPNTPNRGGMQPPHMMPTFLPLGGMNNPMFGLGGLHPQLSPQFDGNTGARLNKTSNSPHMTASPPNLFVPPFPSANPPPPNLGGLKPFGPGGIPSPNLSTLPTMPRLPGFHQQPRTTSPSPPVSPLMNAPMPFLPSPHMLQPNNPGMPPMNLNNPLFHRHPMANHNQPPINLTNKFNNMNLSGVHKPLNMQNPMLHHHPQQDHHPPH